MKKLLSMAVLAAFMIACNDSSTKVETAGIDSTTMSGDAMVADSSGSMASTMDTSAKSNAMAPQEGTMTMKEGKMMVMKDGGWVKMEKTITCTDGCKVMPSGQVVMNDGMKMAMTEGEMIDKDGHITDKNGKMMDMMMDHKMNEKDSVKAPN